MLVGRERRTPPRCSSQPILPNWWAQSLSEIFCLKTNCWVWVLRNYSQDWLLASTGKGTSKHLCMCTYVCAHTHLHTHWLANRSESFLCEGSFLGLLFYYWVCLFWRWCKPSSLLWLDIIIWDEAFPSSHRWSFVHGCFVKFCIFHVPFNSRFIFLVPGRISLE